MRENVEYATQMQLPAGDPAEHITAVVSVVAAVTKLLVNAKGKVKGITLLPEELAKELYCIALSENPEMAKTLEAMDVQDESLTLPKLQVCLRDAELNAKRRKVSTAVGLYGSLTDESRRSTCSSPTSVSSPASNSCPSCWCFSPAVCLCGPSPTWYLQTVPGIQRQRC